MMTYRFLTEDEIVDLVNPVLAQRGWAMLNTATARVMGAFDGADLLETLTIQLHPLLGPMVKHVNDHRDNGTVSRELARRMDEFLVESNARGWMAIADNPVTERLCERHGMHKITSPVYVY